MHEKSIWILVYLKVKLSMQTLHQETMRSHKSFQMDATHTHWLLNLTYASAFSPNKVVKATVIGTICQVWVTKRQLKKKKKAPATILNPSGSSALKRHCLWRSLMTSSYSMESHLRADSSSLRSSCKSIMNNRQRKNTHITAEAHKWSENHQTEWSTAEKWEGNGQTEITFSISLYDHL